jgi:D-alanyl-D-alanine carboxypeptidase/D-alanyl-D-alanine-endopeptidase (penicillin-binding protein 4)
VPSESPSADQAESEVEQTAVLPAIASERDDRKDAGSDRPTAPWPTQAQVETAAPEAPAPRRPEVPEAEQTQQISRADLDQVTGRGSREEIAQPTNRITRDDLPQGYPPRSTDPSDETATPPSGIPVDSGPPTMRIQAVPPAPEVPRSASPQDFAGLARPQASPTQGPMWTPVPRGPAAPQRPGQVPPEPRQAQPWGVTRPIPHQPAPTEDREPEPRAEEHRQPQRVFEKSEPERKSAPPRLHRRRALIGLALLVVVGLGASIAFGPAIWGPTPLADPPPPVRLRPAIKPVSDTAPAPAAQGLAAALSASVSNPALGTFGGLVLDAKNGQTLWQQNAGQPLIPASTGKLLTTSAALLTLDHQQRFSTKVVRGGSPGSVVLVGGGDPTLSSLPAGRESVYPGAAHLDDLVAQVKAATRGQVTSISVDTGRYKGAGSAPGWLPEDVAGGFVSPMESVMLDGGRADPTQDVSPRTQSPALDAGRKLATRLGLSESSVQQGAAAPNAPVLGEVKSAPVQDMVETVLQHSDNVLAEALARQVAIATGNEPSFAGSTKAVREVLARNAFDLNGTSMVDGSGLSLQDHVTPKTLGSLLEVATAPQRPEGGLPDKSRKLRSLLPGLPVAGGSGSLADRYQNDGGRGWVRAKTGTLSNANSLAGTVVTQDGRLLVFALMSNGTGSTGARPALDAVASALRDCGCR